MTYDEQTLMAQAVKLAEMLICDDELLNADAKTFTRNAAILGMKLRYESMRFVRWCHHVADSDVLVGHAEPTDDLDTAASVSESERIMR